MSKSCARMSRWSMSIWAAKAGFDLAEQLHRPNSHAGPKVILTSAHSEQDFADMIAASPAVGFLAKADLSPDAVQADGSTARAGRGQFFD